MKIIAFTILVLAVSCGGSTGAAKKSKQPKLVRMSLDGEIRVSEKQATDEIKTNHINQLNELYVNQSFETKSSKLQRIADMNQRTSMVCKFEIIESATVVDFDQKTVKLFVDKSEKTSKKCEQYSQAGRSVQKHKRTELFNVDFKSTRFSTLEIFRGFHHGQLRFSMAGEGTMQGVKIQATALMNPTVSNLYAAEVVKVRATIDGKLVHQESTTRRKLNDVDASSIDLTGVPEVEVTEALMAF